MTVEVEGNPIGFQVHKEVELSADQSTAVVQLKAAVRVLEATLQDALLARWDHDGHL